MRRIERNIRETVGGAQQYLHLPILVVIIELLSCQGRSTNLFYLVLIWSEEPSNLMLQRFSKTPCNYSGTACSDLTDGTNASVAGLRKTTNAADACLFGRRA